MIRQHSRGVSAIVRVIVAAVVIGGGAALLAPVTRASTDLCGATVLEDVYLDQDLVCAGSGITVGADGIRIHLQGHTITGPGIVNTTGIMVAGHSDVSILGGTIERFFTGVLTINASGVEIKDMVLRANVDGVDMRAGSTGITIKASEFVGNTTRGVMMRGEVDGADVKDNTFAGNRVGVLINGPTNSTVKANTITASLLAGIRVGSTATDNLVLDNLLTSNPSGIEFLPDPLTGGGAIGNTFKANTLNSNNCGLKGPGSGNTFLDNVFSGNTTDVCG
jgi:nitrous oxidase accessory protein NosD